MANVSSVSDERPATLRQWRIPASVTAAWAKVTSWLRSARQLAGPGYIPGLIATCFSIPLIATVITVAMYATARATDAEAIWFGLLGSIVVWLLESAVAQRFVTARQSNPARYALASARIEALGERLDDSKKSMASESSGPVKDGASALLYNRTQEAHDKLERKLETPSSGWFFGYRWVELWRDIHAAEAQSLGWAPLDLLASEAMQDVLRLTGSTIGTREQLLAMSATAASQLGSPVSEYFAAYSATVKGANPPQQGTTSTTTPDAQAQARALLGRVRLSVETYRDDLWDHLASSFLQFLVGIFTVGWVTFALAAFMEAGHIAPTTVSQAAGLYLVGAFFGIFARIVDEGRKQAPADDYGHKTARIVITPLVSGMAALAGAVIYFVVTVILKNPSQLVTGLSPTGVPLSGAFNFRAYPAELVVAGIFGITPSLLITYVQKQTNVLLGAIQSSNVTQTTDKDPTNGNNGSNGSSGTKQQGDAPQTTDKGTTSGGSGATTTTTDQKSQ